MTDALERQALLPHDVVAVRKRKLEATQSLLGSTIAISEDDWQHPSLLPGWTRAHVATHLARNADGLIRLIHGVSTGVPTRMYGSDRERQRDIERGSERGALDLQIDLDTTAGRLSAALDAIAEVPGETAVELPAGRWVRVDLLPLARLNEVVLHHVDLDCGFGIDHVDEDIARWLLEWNAFWIGERADFPAVEILSDSGFSARLGAPGEPVQVLESDSWLLGWITARLPVDDVTARGLPVFTR